MESTLFKGFSLSASLFAGYFYQEGLQYLEDNVFPFILQIRNSERGSWEIKSNKESEINIELNVNELTRICSALLSRIFHPSTNLPRPIITMLDIMRTEINEKFGNNTAEKILVS